MDLTAQLPLFTISIKIRNPKMLFNTTWNIGEPPHIVSSLAVVLAHWNIVGFFPV